MVVITDADQWRQASETLRRCPFISIAVAKPYESGPPPPRLGAVTLYAKPRDDQPVGHVYAIQPSAIAEDLRQVIFGKLEEILGE